VIADGLGSIEEKNWAEMEQIWRRKNRSGREEQVEEMWRRKAIDNRFLCPFSEGCRN
jgi:hypothetical protein